MMSNQENSERKPKPVTVVYFPKRTTGQPKGLGTTMEVISSPLPESSSGDESVTEPIATEQLEAALARGAANSSRKGEAGQQRRRKSDLPQPNSAELEAAWKMALLLLQRGGRISGMLPPEAVSRMSFLGHQLFEAQRVKEAGHIFQLLARVDPKDSFTRTMLGTIHLAQGNPDLALRSFEAALKLDRHDLAALVYRGEIRLQEGKVRAGVEDLNRAVELGPAEDPFVQRARKLLRLASQSSKKRRK
jgi:cytochrome c-type biogenesis protein CcmH/NrfG